MSSRYRISIFYPTWTRLSCRKKWKPIIGNTRIDFYFQIDYICYFYFPQLRTHSLRPRNILVGYSQGCLWLVSLCTGWEYLFYGIKNINMMLTPEIIIKLYITYYCWRYFWGFFRFEVVIFIFCLQGNPKNNLFLAGFFTGWESKTLTFLSLAFLWFCDALQMTGGVLEGCFAEDWH